MVRGAVFQQRGVRCLGWYQASRIVQKKNDCAVLSEQHWNIRKCQTTRGKLSDKDAKLAGVFVSFQREYKNEHNAGNIKTFVKQLL